METVSLARAFAGLDSEEKTVRYRELWHRAGRFEILPDYPLHLDLELSGICNLACKDCFQEALDKKSLGLMDDALFQKLVDEGAERGLCAVKFQIRGESFLHPRLFDHINYAKERGLLDLQITTNATLLDEIAVENVLESGLDGIIFSVDLRHEQAIANKGKAASPVEANVQRFLERRKERGITRPWVRIKTASDNATPRAMNALKEQMAREYPLADIFIVGKIFDFRKDVDSFPDLRQNYVLNPCSYLTQRLAVFFNGLTTVCCMDYHGDFGLGKVPDDSIRDIWLSPKLEQLRQAHLAGKRPELPICRHCHLCIGPANVETFVDDTPRNRLDYELKENPA